MLVALKVGKRIYVDKKSNESLLAGYANKLLETKIGNMYEIHTYGIANVHIKKIIKNDTEYNIYILNDVYSSLDKAQKSLEPPKQQQKKKKKEKPLVFEVTPLEDEEEVNVLWCSRHNMQTEGYLSLCDDVFPNKRVRVFPCQPRVVDVQQIIGLADRFGCKVIAAILPDDMYRDLVHTTSISRVILKPHISTFDTNSNYCPKGSKKIITQRKYGFLYWEDMRMSYKYPNALHIEEA